MSQIPADAIESMVSPGRFATYVAGAGGDREKAVDLYQWNVALSAACFEALHYVEVLVRNALDREMRRHLRENDRGIPWFLLEGSGFGEAGFRDAVDRVRERLRKESSARETRDQIIAGTDFGFWTSLLQNKNEQLWRDALHQAFPYSSGLRKDVGPPLHRLRLLRNKLAHHDSLLAVDVPFELDQMLLVLSWIDPRAEQWLRATERVSTTYLSRPERPNDTVVVGAKDAWTLYESTGAYLCQVGRSFQPVARMAFYADQEIKADVPAVRRRVDNVEWTESEAARLLKSSAVDDQRLGAIIRDTRVRGWTNGRYQVFDLTRPGEPGHLQLSAAIPHPLRGRGSAFTQRQRYVAYDALRRATSTQDL